MAATVPSETASSTIVLLGAFNPAILQPRWLAAAEALPEAEADAAEKNPTVIISREITVVQFPSFALEATPDRFTLTTSPEIETPYLLRDAVVNIFTLLSHTPIRLLGMNHSRHIELQEGVWSNLREKLAPSDPWDGLVEGSQLASLSTTAARTDDLDGSMRITVEPSVHLDAGVWISINDHVDLGAKATDAKRAVEVLDERWEQSLTNAEEIMDRISAAA